MDLTEYTRETLHGLEGVFIIVEALKADIEADGLTAEDLKSLVESKLSATDIKILTHEEWRAAADHPWLYVSINTIKFLAGHFYSLDLQLRQEVSVVRENSLSTNAATWELGSVGFSVITEVPGRVRHVLEGFLDRFIQDHTLVNTRQSESSIPQ
jgi:hypothetical protein